ncbi:MAG: serine/threonine protein kinase [Clostridia bacterium]|nr:serine/threonine protein kinase [Clostridia bacterium]
MAQIGQVIDGKYEILAEIGRGGMSVVYLAMDKRLNKQWAIKEFRKDKNDEAKQMALEALLKEANLMKKLDHPTLPRIVDIIDEKVNVYIIMDYIEGENLSKVLDEYGAQDQENVIEWAKQIADVLDYLHTRTPPVIYRDMKPANIMLRPDGTVRLIDFGIAREYKEGKAGDTQNIGTRGYAAPEQFGDRGQTDARTDIYSFGVTLYHLVTGQNPAEPPYEIYPIRRWNPELSSGLEWLISKCTQLNPKDRFQSCSEILYVLENLEKFEDEYRRKQRSRLSVFLTTAILTVVFTLGTVFSYLGYMRDNVNQFRNLIDNDNRSVENYLEAFNKYFDDVGEDDKKNAYEGCYNLLFDYKLGDATDDVEKVIKQGDLDSIYSQSTNTEEARKLRGLDFLKANDTPIYCSSLFVCGKLYWEKGDYMTGGKKFRRILDEIYTDLGESDKQTVASTPVPDGDAGDGYNDTYDAFDAVVDDIANKVLVHNDGEVWYSNWYSMTKACYVMFRVENHLGNQASSTDGLEKPGGADADSSSGSDETADADKMVGIEGLTTSGLLRRAAHIISKCSGVPNIALTCLNKVTIQSEQAKNRLKGDGEDYDEFISQMRSTLSEIYSELRENMGSDQTAAGILDNANKVFGFENS